LTKGQIRKLRRKSHEFVSTEMLNILISEFENQDIDKELFNVKVNNTKISDQDPETIEIIYQSVFEELPYIEQKVLVEIGVRSLLKPSENKGIKSIIDENYASAQFSEEPFTIKTIRPEKTFLEKLILLHEEFSKPIEKIRYHRMSRHLYDIGEIVTTDFGVNALRNKELFEEIISHRKVFTPIKTVDYEKLKIENLIIIPPKEFFKKYENDYVEIRENMIYGNSMTFKLLINKIITESPPGNNV